MLSNIDKQQTLLDIQILAVQIDTHRQLQRETKSQQLHSLIQQQKRLKFEEFKSSKFTQFKKLTPLTLTCVAIGIITTRTLAIGSSIGLGATYMLKPYVTNFFQNLKQ